MDGCKGYVDAAYLHKAAELFAPIKQRSHELLQLVPGNRVLDVGCGAGVDLPALGYQVGASGLVVGVDQDQRMVIQATHADSRTESTAVVLTASGESLPFADSAFEACRAERVFMHLSRPAQVLAEMMRVLVPGGRLVIAETDWGSASLDCVDVDLETRLNRFRAEQLMHGGYCARHLYRLYRQAGLVDLHCEVQTLVLHDRVLYDQLARLRVVEEAALAAGVVQAGELTRWRADLDQAGELNAFFATVNVVTVRGLRCG